MEAFEELANKMASNHVVPPEMRGYFQQEMAALNNQLSMLDSSYVSGVQNIIEVYQNTDNIYNTQVVVTGAEQFIDGTAIYEVTEDNCTNINYTMKRYVMANPEMRELYNEEVISGYDGLFIDVSEGEDELEWNEDYLTVMNGVVDDDGIATIYDADIELHELEQFNIIDSWNNMLCMIERGIDPTKIEE